MAKFEKAVQIPTKEYIIFDPDFLFAPVIYLEILEKI